MCVCSLLLFFLQFEEEEQEEGDEEVSNDQTAGMHTVYTLHGSVTLPAYIIIHTTTYNNENIL